MDSKRQFIIIKIWEMLTFFFPIKVARNKSTIVLIFSALVIYRPLVKFSVAKRFKIFTIITKINIIM